MLPHFATQRDQLADILLTLSHLYQDHEDTARLLITARSTLLDERFKVIVMGQMKMGKSTLINALLGIDLLPTLRKFSCTAIPISVQYGDSGHAVAYPADDRDPLHFALPDERVAFHAAVSIHDHDLNPLASDAADETRPYSKADIFYPIDILKSGVVVVDSPGLEEDDHRSDLSWQHLKDADAIVFLPDFERLGHKPDRDALRHIARLSRDPSTCFVVWNSMDRDRGGEICFEQYQRSVHAVSDPLGIPREHVHILSAQMALEARHSGSEDDLAKSGLLAFEHSLQVFLGHQRVRAKLLTPLAVAHSAVDRDSDSLLAGMESDAQLIRLHANEALSNSSDILRRSKAAYAGLSASLDSCKRSLQLHMKREADLFISRHTQQVEAFINGVDISTQGAASSPDDIAKGLAQAASTWLADHARQWDRDHIAGVMDQYWTDVNRHVLDAANDLHDLLSEARQSASSLIDDTDESTSVVLRGVDDIHEPSPIQLDDFSLTMPGSSSNSEVSIAGILATTTGIAVASFIFPPFMIAAAVAAAASAIQGTKEKERRIKNKVIEEVTKALGKCKNRLETALLARVEAVCVSKSPGMDHLLANISAIRCIAETMQEHSALEIQRADVIANDITRIRRELQRHRIELSAIRDAIDPAMKIESKIATQATRLDTKLDSIQSTMEGFARNRSPRPLVEPNEHFPTEDRRCLKLVAEHFQARGGWEDRMESELVLAWSRYREAQAKSGKRSRREPQAFFTATAYAASKGHPTIVDPKIVYQWWANPECQDDLAVIYRIIANGDDPRLRQTQEGEFVENAMGFPRSYYNAHKKLVKHFHDLAPSKRHGGPRSEH